MLPRLMCTALALTLLYVPARAEKDHDRDQKKQPELHIRLVVVPAVIPPHHKGGGHGREDTIIYKLEPVSEQFSIKKEFLPMLIETGRQEQVELTTIVVK